MEWRGKAKRYYVKHAGKGMAIRHFMLSDHIDPVLTFGGEDSERSSRQA